MRRRFLRAISVTHRRAVDHVGAGCSSPSSGAAEGVGPGEDEPDGRRRARRGRAGLYIAQNEGLFAAEGLHVTIDPILSSADATKGQNSGKFDITAGNAVSYVQAR